MVYITIISIIAFVLTSILNTGFIDRVAYERKIR